MKPTPETVTFVCESFKVPMVQLKDASERILNPVGEVKLAGWRRIHSEITKINKN